MNIGDYVVVRQNGKVGIINGYEEYVDHDGYDEEGCPIYRKLKFLEVEFENYERESYLPNELIKLEEKENENNK